jgi:hypothetical protein
VRRGSRSANGEGGMTNEERRRARRMKGTDLQAAASEAVRLLQQVWQIRGRIEKLSRSRDAGDMASLALLRERLQHVYSDYCAAHARSQTLSRELDG